VSKRVGITYGNIAKVEPYAKALRSVGVEPVLIDASSDAQIEELDGLLLSGGTDLNPKLYGQEPRPENDAPDDARDAMEQRLLAEALDRDLPVLAICRGMQLFNVAHGGALDQHVESHRQKGVTDAHAIEVQPGTKLAAVTRGAKTVVNSRHHQIVDRVGDGLVVSARSPEGYPEALERNDKRFAVAVQWHPEDLVERNPDAKRLFLAFAEAL